MAKRTTIPIGLASVAGMRYSKHFSYKLSEIQPARNNSWSKLLHLLEEFGKQTPQKTVERATY